MTRPFRWNHKVWTFGLDHDLWPTFENFNIGHNLFVLRGVAFSFGLHGPYDKDFSDGTINCEHVTLPKTFELHLNNFNIANNFLSYEIELSYLACVFLMTRPFFF